MPDDPKALREKRQAFFSYLDHRIPELHASGTLGSTARAQAEQEYRVARGLAHRHHRERGQDR